MHKAVVTPEAHTSKNYTLFIMCLIKDFSLFNSQSQTAQVDMKTCSRGSFYLCDREINMAKVLIVPKKFLSHELNLSKSHLPEALHELAS